MRKSKPDQSCLLGGAVKKPCKVRENELIKMQGYYPIVKSGIILLHFYMAERA